MKLKSKIIEKVKSVTKEEMKEGFKKYRKEIFCGTMAAVALFCYLGVRSGPKPNVAYVTINLRNEV